MHRFLSLLFGLILLGCVPGITGLSVGFRNLKGNHIDKRRSNATFEEAVEQWKLHGTLETDFFLRPWAQCDGDCIGADYVDKLERILKKDPESFRHWGEAATIGKYAFGPSSGKGFNCTSSNTECVNKPSWKDMMEHIGKDPLNKYNGTLTPEQQVREFYMTITILNRLDATNVWFKNNEQIMNDAVTGLMAKSGGFIKRYTRQKSLKAEQACALLKRLNEWMCGIFENVHSFFWNVVTAQSIMGSQSAATKIPSPAAILNSLLFELPKLYAEVNQQQKAENQEHAWENQLDLTTKGDRLQLNQRWLHGVCAHLGGDVPDENLENYFMTNEFIDDSFSTMRTVLNLLQDRAMFGNSSSEHSRLASVMRMDSTDFESGISPQRDRKPQFTSEVQRSLENIVISSLSENKKCHMSCREEEGIGEWYCAPGNGAKNPNHRFCPKNEPNFACKMQCITTQETGNKVFPFDGDLNHDHRSLQEMGEQSWLAYRQRGNRYLSLANATGDQLFGLNNLANGTMPTLTLPVCLSKHNEILDRPSKWEEWNFPCSCGNHLSDETQEFFAHLGFAKHQRDFLNAPELMNQICPFQQSVALESLPLNNFLAECEINIQWPTTDTKRWPLIDAAYHFDVRQNASDHCPRIKTRVRNLNEIAANDLFCDPGPLGIAHEIFSVEREKVSYWPGKGPMSNHAIKCKEYRKTRDGKS